MRCICESVGACMRALVFLIFLHAYGCAFLLCLSSVLAVLASGALTPVLRELFGDVWLGSAKCTDVYF